MKDEREPRTLCPRCRRDYLDAGYRLELVPGKRILEPCEKCARPGRDYYIINDERLREGLL